MKCPNCSNEMKREKAKKKYYESRIKFFGTNAVIPEEEWHCHNCGISVEIAELEEE